MIYKTTVSAKKMGSLGIVFVFAIYWLKFKIKFFGKYNFGDLELRVYRDGTICLNDLDGEMTGKIVDFFNENLPKFLVAGRVHFFFNPKKHSIGFEQTNGKYFSCDYMDMLDFVKTVEMLQYESLKDKQ